MANIELIKIHKRYSEVHVVKGINLSIKSGEFIVLLGPSGCGKSTMLRMIAGLEDISSGKIKIADRVVNDLEPKERNIAMVFQSYALYPHLTVYKNIAFGLRLSKMDKKLIDEKVLAVAELLELSSLLKRKPKELSGGQRQRVAMGRAMVRRPDVFLFDEPLSNLDAKLRNTMRTEIRQLHDRIKKTTVYVTHDQVEAMTLADRVVILNTGVIEQIGKPRDVFLYPINKFVAGFIGSPTMNFLNGHVQVDASSKPTISLFDTQYELPHEYLGSSSYVCVGIRPSDIYASTQECTCSKELLKVQVEIQNYELLGSTALVVVNVGGEELHMEVSAALPVSNGSSLPIYLDMSQLHIFDIESGKALYRTLLI